MSIESVMPSNHLILCHSLVLLPSIFPSIRVFFNESALCIRWSKYWSFSFSISPSNKGLPLGLNGLICFCFISYAKAFDCVDHNKLWKILKEMRISDYLICLLRNLYAGQEATVRTRYRKQIGSKLGKEYIKAVYCHPAYLTYVQSTS